LNVKDFGFYLPEELIAQEPIEQRDHSRLLVLNKANGSLEHKIFKNIEDYMEEGDCLVLNNSRVIPARLFGEKENTGAKMEFVLLKRIDKNRWETLVKPGKKAQIGTKFIFGSGELTCEIIDHTEAGGRIIEFQYEGIFEEILDKLGQMPLPPYIKKQLKDKERYQTVYSKVEGSAAAPTAGLHFTKELLEKLAQKGINIAYVTLHVGLGTFRPVKVDVIEEHVMHSEYYSIDEENARIINETKKNGKKVIAVGTTSCRTLETVAQKAATATTAAAAAMSPKTDIIAQNDVTAATAVAATMTPDADATVQKPITIRSCSGWTDIFIYPGYEFKLVDKLITNFHLPESTLIMLVSALAGQENVMKAYDVAVKEEYRFFSFGDAMFIV
jgi:S-adenosylmethionine:tRNA ribosyltransferase-isomerase